MLILKILIILSVPLLLETAAVCIIISKVKTNRRFMENSKEMSAVVTHKDSKKVRMTNSRYTLYNFIADADNGSTYEISSKGIKASLIQVGDTVKIRVPHGAPTFVPKNERFEAVIQNKELLHTLSGAEKRELNDYMTRQVNAVSEKAEYILSGKRSAVLAQDGSGLKGDIIGFCILAVLMAGFIVYAINFIITEVMI